MKHRINSQSCHHCVACSRSWNLGGWNTVIKDIQPDRHRSGLAVEDRSEGKANYLFADGQQLVDANIIKSMIEAGLNQQNLPTLNFNKKLKSNNNKNEKNILKLSLLL